MPRQLVAVARLFPFNLMIRGLGCFGLCWLLLSVSPAIAEIPEIEAPGFLARVNLNEPAEVAAIFQRADDYFLTHRLEKALPPIVVVLHGPEIEIFTRQNYGQYREIVDLAAKLSALNVVDVRICETRMGLEGVEKADLMPFVGTVPFGPDEIDRLVNQEEYVYF